MGRGSKKEKLRIKKQGKGEKGDGRWKTEEERRKKEGVMKRAREFEIPDFLIFLF